ncbi:MAG: 30S ribosomal protein S7 [Patescibacteria group bacterium]
MPRRPRVLKRPSISPDAEFNSLLVSKLINRLMWNGKKTVATKIVVSALKAAAEELNVTPLEVLDISLKNVCPQIEVRGVRVGGANYQVPMEVMEPRKTRLGMTWLIASARSMKGMPMDQKLAKVLIDSFNGVGSAVEKRNSVHRTAAGNRALAHLASRIGGGKRKKTNMFA